ncbi:MAG: VCBS repeat-containing protein [Candidatus Acidiferrum sp.]
MFSLVHKNFGARAARGALLVLCFALAVAARTNAAASPNHLSNASPAFSSYFAIADFDGDRKPDYATVEVQNGSSGSITQYSIRFRLTAGASQSFGVSAPAGGLQIVARDVNGDDALDLLVTTAWLHKQVAVLLNDGHGNFTLAKPEAFPAAIWNSAAVWASGELALGDSAALVRSESPAGKFSAQNRFYGWQAQRGIGQLPLSLGRSRLLLFSLLGRAPPLLIFQA